MAAGLTNYLRNKLIDWFHRGQAFTPPATIYIALVKTTPTAAAAGTEVTGTSYARQAVASTNTAWATTNAAGTTGTTSSGTSGTTSNNAAIDFGTAGSAWGTVTHWEAYDASSGGNRLMFGAITDPSGTPTPRTISSGDPVKWPISAFQIIWG